MESIEALPKLFAKEKRLHFYGSIKPFEFRCWKIPNIENFNNLSMQFIKRANVYLNKQTKNEFFFVRSSTTANTIAAVVVIPSIAHSSIQTKRIKRIEMNNTRVM